jgi:hypothetical protein
MFAVSYWLTGTVNFHVIGTIGNLFLVGACAILVLAVTGWERRIRLGVVLAFMMFQLEHFESFIWSGASIDHFQVVMLSVAALALVARGSPRALTGAMGCGLLATFTLAHGNLVWPLGALLLAHQRRWNHLVAWGAFSVLALAAFLYGFKFNPDHHIASLGIPHLIAIARYWLALLGGPLTLGDAPAAPLPGLFLLAGLGLLVARGALTRDPVALFSAFFAIGALALVACGRAELATTEINSRYLVLGALAWAMLIYMLLELATEEGKPFRLLTCMLPALAAFNVAANVKFAPDAEGFVEIRDRAATRFKQYGQDGVGLWRLHPQEGHAETLLRRAKERGVYELPRVSEPGDFPDAQPSSRIISYVDELLVNDRSVTVGGWAMFRDEESKRGQVYLMLRSRDTTCYFSALTLPRQDVATIYHQPRWRLSGFRAVIDRARLPSSDFEVGVLIDNDGGGEYALTKHRLLLSSDDEKPAKGSVD